MDTRPFPLPDVFSLTEQAAPIPAAGRLLLGLEPLRWLL